MIPNQYTTGQAVKIYSDPLTETNSEGTATLIKRLKRDHGDGLEMWEVEFVGDNYTVIRLIKSPIAKMLDAMVANDD